MKPRSFRLSDPARAIHYEIGLCTRRRFGLRKIPVYLALLTDRCSAIAAGDMPHRSCRTSLLPICFAADLRKCLPIAPVGRHFVLFVKTASGVLIGDLSRQTADVLGSLAGLHG